jgi:hypothetical protein
VLGILGCQIGMELLGSAILHSRRMPGMHVVTNSRCGDNLLKHGPGWQAADVLYACESEVDFDCNTFGGPRYFSPKSVV